MRRGRAVAVPVMMGVAVMVVMGIRRNHPDMLYYNITSAKAFKALGFTNMWSPQGTAVARIAHMKGRQHAPPPLNYIRHSGAVRSIELWCAIAHL